MALLELAFVKDRVPYTDKEVGLLVLRSAEVSVRNQFQEDLMDRILSAASFTRDRRCEQYECRPVLAVEQLDLRAIPLRSVHARGHNGKTTEWAEFV